MTRAILCVAIVVIAGFLFTSGKQVKQTKKQRQIPDQFQIEIGDVPRWLYRHAYNVSINGHLKTDKERVPSILRFNRTMLPADLYEQVYLHKFIIPPDFKPRPDRIDPRNLTFDEMRKIEDEEFFGTEPPYAWIERGWNYTCEVCRMEFPYAGDYYLHVHHHYVTNYSATPIMNWTIIQMQNEQYRNESERGAIDYWHKVSRGELYPDYETVPTVPTVTVILDEPIICHICNASIYNTSEYNPHLLAHVDYENEKMGNLTIKHSRPTKSFDDIHFRKVYVEDSLNTQEEAEYEEAQRIIKEASHSLNTDEIMERTQNLSINKRLLEFGVDSRGFTITWPRIKLAPRMEAFNDSDSVRGDEPIFEDPDINRYHDEKRKKWEEDYLRRRKAQEKGNPDFATYSVESNETAAERRALNITRRKRKYTPKLIYIRRKRHVEEENVRRKRRNVEADATTKKRTPKTTTPYNILLGEKKLRRVNSNKRKKLDVVYRQQLNKIIQKAKQYMKKFNQTKYPTTQSIYEKVHIYKLKEKFKKLNWFLYGLDNYTVPSDVDIDTFTNTPLSTERPLIYKRVEKRDLRKAQMRDYNQHKRRIDELKTLVEKAEIMNAEIQAEGQDGTVIRKKRNVNLEDINLQEIENALKPLSVEKGLETKDEMKILAYQKSLMDSQRQNYKKLLFKRDVNDKLNDDDKNQNESIEFDHSADHYTKKQNGSIEFDNSAPYRKGCTKSYRENMLGGGGGNDNRKKRSVRQRRSLVKPPNILYNERENPKTSVAENEKRKVRDVRKARAHKVLKRSLELMDSDGNKLSPSKLTPSLEAKYGPIFKGKYDHMHDGKSLELRRTEEMSEFSGDKNVTPHRLNETLLRYIETLDTNETLAQALENRDRQGRMKREVVCEDLTDELGSNVRDESRKYHWTNTKSWEWRIKNVNIREYMYRIMENRMKKRTLEPDPDAVLYDMDDASHDKLKHPSYESRERRVAQFYADNGHFSGRTGSDLEIYQDSNPNLFDMREVGPPVTPDDYMYKPKPEIFANRHKKYTNVKPGSRTLRPEGHSTKQYPNPIEFTDKKDYYDSDIEVAKSQFRFRRDLNNDDQNPRLPSVKNKRKFRNRRSAGNLKMIQINETGNSAEIRRQLNLSANPSSAELRALKEKMIYHQRLLDMASAIDTAELSNYSPPNETSYGQYSMVASHKLNPRGGRSKRAAGPNNIEYDSDYSSALQRFEAIDTHPELFAKLYPSQAVYTPYTFYPTTLFGLTDHPDPNATYAWIEKSGPDTEERMNLRQLNALDQSVKDELEYEMASNAMKENTQINSEDYRDWLEWQRNRSLEDQNSYNKIMWTCKFHPCTFNASVEDQVGDHIFVDHFTYPKNYKEAATYVMETTDLGWERLTNVDYLLHRYSDENLHPDIKEDFDIFTGIFDDLSFPTIHPNYTLPSKPKQTRFKPTEHPDMETVPITKPKKHHSTPKHPSKDHHHPHGHPTTSHHPTIDHIAKGHHHRQKRADDYNLSKLPQPPHDSCDKGQPGNPNSEGRPRRRYYRQVNSEQKERHRRNLDDSLPMPTPSKELSGYDGSAFLKTVPPKYRCKYCGDLFHTEKRLLSHKAKKHPRKHTPTTTPCIKMMKNFFTLDSELDLSKNYDFVFSEPDNGSFVQHRPILEDSFYQSFDPTDPDHHVNPASYQEIEDYCDWVFNKSRWQQCQACGKNISDDEAEAHFRKHVSNIKKDYFDELPPEYMDRCFKEAHWNESWETIHHKLKRQYEENRIVDSVFEPETYRCKRCNTTFATHEKTYAHLMEHKHNDSRRSASEAAIRSQLKRERARFEPTTRKEMKEWNPDYIDYLKNAEIDKLRDNQDVTRAVPIFVDGTAENNNKAEKEITGTDTDGKKDDHAERSISENLQTQVKDTIENSRKETQKPIDNTDKSVPLKDTNSENTNAKDPENAREPEYIPEVPDCQINFEEDDNDEEDNNSEEDEDTSDSDANSTDEEGDSTKPVKKRFNSNKAEPSLEEFIAKMKNTYRLLTSQNILNNQSTLLRRIEKMIGLNTDPGQAVFHRRNKRFIDRVVDSDYSDNVTYEVLADRWVSTECNVVDKLSKKFNTTIKDKGKGHKLLETDVSRLIEDFGVGQHPNLTSEENRLRLRSFRECMKIIDFKETRSEQDYHVMYDDHLDYMRLKTESPTLSPSDESLLRSRPRNEYSDYEDLVSDKWNCEECNTTFDNYTAFLEHMKKPKEPKWPYLIDVENAKMKKSIENFFTTKSYWVNECFECKQHFNTRQELLDHINAKGYDSLPHVEKVDQTVKCVHCDVAFTNVQKYLEHRAVLAEAEQRLKNLTGGEKEFCGDCKKYFDNHEDFLEHLNVERAKDYEDMPKYVCKKCNFTYLDSISLGLHMNKIHPQEDEKNRKRRKRRNCREENMVKVNVVPEHMDYAIMKHIVMKTVNKNRRKKRDTEHKKSQKKNRIKKRELKLKRVMKVKRESLDKKMNNKLKRDATIFMNKMEEVAQVKNKGHNIRKRAIDNGKRILKENIVPKDIVSNNKAIVNKRRKKRSVDDLMDKIDKEYEKYIMYKYDPQFNVHHPILMFEEYRYALLKGYAAHETLLEKEERKKEKELLEASAKNQDLKAKEKDKWMDFVEEGNTYAYGPAMFGTTWSYNLWPTIRYNVLGPGKSYNNTQYFNQYYYNQTIKQHIKAIFREYFAEPLNASYPVPTFVEPERDTEELESLARKDRRKRSVDNDIINDNLDEELNDNVDGNIDNEIHGSRKKRHSIDRPCFNDQMRERLTIGKKIDKKCKCKNKDAEKIGGQQETNKMHDNVNHIDDTVKHIDGNNAMKNDMNDKIELNDTVHDIHMKRIKQRTPKATTPKTPRSTYRKRENDDDDEEQENEGEVKDLLNEGNVHDAAQEPFGIIAEAVHGLQAPEAAARRCRARRQVRVDVMNNNTIQKINWEKLAKILVAENRNLSNLLDKHLPKKTTPMRKYECKHCGDRFPGLQPYVEHMIMHEKEFDMELSYPEEFNITCDHCYQIFSTEDAIHEHNLERLRILKEKEAADYVELNRTTRIKRFSPYEHPFTLGIMENQDNTFWNPTTPVYTDDPAEDKYYCYYCKDMMINTKEFVEHKKWHEVSRKQAKEAYIVRKKKIEDKIREDFDIKGSIHM
uniref:C2H2-type domain-containing protein n=1 Tax=Cacopsylla melanoneura TaxID=428564 RepID=A0A8D8VSP4_9HEMI